MAWLLTVFLFSCVSAETMHMTNKYTANAKADDASPYQSLLAYMNQFDISDVTEDMDTLDRMHFSDMGLSLRELLHDGVVSKVNKDGKELCTGGRCVCYFESEMGAAVGDLSTDETDNQVANIDPPAVDAAAGRARTDGGVIRNGMEVQASFCMAESLCEKATWKIRANQSDDTDQGSSEQISSCLTVRTVREGPGVAKTKDEQLPRYKIEHDAVSDADVVTWKEWYGTGSLNGTYGVEGAGCEVVNPAVENPDLTAADVSYKIGYPVTRCCVTLASQDLCPDNYTFTTYFWDNSKDTNNCCYYAGVNKHKLHEGGSTGDWNRDAAGNFVAPGGAR